MTLNEWKSGQPALTVNALADMCGVTRLTMHRLLTGQTMPRAATMERIRQVTAGAVSYDAMLAARKAG